MRALILLNRGGVGGGHVVQATKTAEAVQSLGVDVVVSESAEPDCRGFDVVHSFGASRDTLRDARIAGCAVAVSPIWWSAAYVTQQAPASRRRTAERALRLTHSTVRRGIDETARRLREPLVEKALQFELADILLPNSRLEAAQVRADLGVTTPMHVVPNAFDDQLFTPPDDQARRAGVAFVGRIEPHKNPLGLIRELSGTGISLTIAGPDHPHHSAYSELCRQVADSSVTFVPAGDQLAMRDVYRAALVHVLPSWFETTGLASLEAAATGCAVVTTDRGYAREYFGDAAVYCDPGTKGSILGAVRTALASGSSQSLRELVLDRFTWAHAAKATIEGYESALRSRVR